MSEFYQLLFSQQALTTGDAMDPKKIQNLGGFNTLGALVRVHSPATGDAPQLLIEHAASLEGDETAWIAFDPPIAVDLSAVGDTWVSAEGYSRYVRWSVTGTIDTPPVVSLEFVAKR